MKSSKLVSIAVVVAMLAAGCNSTSKKEGESADSGESIPVKVIELGLSTIARTIDYTATVDPHEELNLSPATPGLIEEMYIEVGDRVRKGDRLFLMDRTQLIQSKIQLSSLEKDLARLDTLLRTGSTREQQYDQMKTQYEMMKSNVAFLEENTLLLAPFNAIITGRYFEAGEMYSGAPSAASGGKAAILTLMQINPVKLIINVSEQHFTMIRKGMSVGVTSDLYEDELFKGRISLVHPTINPMTRSFQTEIEVPNADERLRPGMFVRVAIDMGEVETFVVPANTVLLQEGTNIRYVFVEKDGVISRVEVELGKRYDDMLEVISDKLAVGSRIVSEGQTRLTSGDRVKVIN